MGAAREDQVMILPEETPRLRSARTLLRPFQDADVEGRMRCGKDPEIIRMFGGSPAYPKAAANTL